MVTAREYLDELREQAARLATDARKDPEARRGAFKRIGEQLSVP